MRSPSIRRPLWSCSLVIHGSANRENRARAPGQLLASRCPAETSSQETPRVPSGRPSHSHSPLTGGAFEFRSCPHSSHTSESAAPNRTVRTAVTGRRRDPRRPEAALHDSRYLRHACGDRGRVTRQARWRHASHTSSSEPSRLKSAARRSPSGSAVLECVVAGLRQAPIVE